MHLQHNSGLVFFLQRFAVEIREFISPQFSQRPWNFAQIMHRLSRTVFVINFDIVLRRRKNTSEKHWANTTYMINYRNSKQRNFALRQKSAVVVFLHGACSMQIRSKTSKNCCENNPLYEQQRTLSTSSCRMHCSVSWVVFAFEG